MHRWLLVTILMLLTACTADDRPRADVKISIDSSGACQVDERAVSCASVARQIAAAHKGAKIRVTVSASPRTEYRRVNRVVQDLKSVGIDYIDFETVGSKNQL